MSDFLASAGSALTGALGGFPNLSAGSAVLRPASFRGVPFVVDVAAGEGGRRIVTHEFPLRDQPYTEDLGRAAQRHRIRAFVIGDDYQDKRDALLAACQDKNTAGTLVHPFLGERQCRSGLLRWSESKDRGGYAAFDIDFVEDGKQAVAAQRHRYRRWPAAWPAEAAARHQAGLCHRQPCCEAAGLSARVCREPVRPGRREHAWPAAGDDRSGCVRRSPAWPVRSPMTMPRRTRC